MTNFYLSMAPHLIFLPSTQNFFNSHDTTRLHSRASSKVQNNRKILHPRPVNFKLAGKPENHKWLGSDLLKKMSHNWFKNLSEVALNKILIHRIRPHGNLVILTSYFSWNFNFGPLKEIKKSKSGIAPNPK